jgi:hypothetical protein
MHSPSKNRSQTRLEAEDQDSSNGKDITLFSIPAPALPYHAHARAPRFVAAQLLFSGEIGSGPPRIKGSPLDLCPQISSAMGEI